MYIALNTETAAWRVLDPRGRLADLADDSTEVTLEVSAVHAGYDANPGPPDAIRLEAVQYYGPNQHFSLTTTDDLGRALRMAAAALRESGICESGLPYDHRDEQERRR